MFNTKKKQAAEALRAQIDQIAKQNSELERRLAALTQANAELDHRLGTTGARLVELSEQTSVIDARVTNVSTELTNQLVELSRDIDTLNQDDRTADTSADTSELEARLTERVDVAIDDVLDATERLAAEQARYEIKFRADLAELADRVRRPSAR